MGGTAVIAMDDITHTAEHTSAPLARVHGSPFHELPDDLYIPPDALEVFLDTFEGPLDLLLYLIKRQNLDILDIPVAAITRQYIEYIEMMSELRMELAAEYLVMAAMLAELKSRMLLPRPAQSDEDETDPRAELVRRLQEYECFKKAAEDLDEFPRRERDTFELAVGLEHIEINKPLPEIQLKEMLLAFQDVLRRAEQLSHHHILREPLSVRERMTSILEKLKTADNLPFVALFSHKEGRRGVVVSFLAILELSKEGLIEILQSDPLAEVRVRPAQA